MDSMVLATQKWLNRTYGDDPRFNVVAEDGATGWETIYGLMRAFQIELGIQETADAFGPTTKRLMNEQYPNGIQEQAEGATAESNVYGIIQGALWCKGYSTGSAEITRHFYDGTGAGVKELRSDMGLSNGTSTVTLNIMEALLSMKQYVLVAGGSTTIRSIQQALNGSYEAYVGLIPCDGYYGREMNDGLIKVLQAIEGFSPDEATGNFGEGTKSRCPVLPDNSEPEATKLLKYALCCNGYELNDLSGTWMTETTNQVIEFQNDYCLEADGIAGLNTWMALLLSCGNPARAALGCDCATVLNADKATALYRAGYRYVGRYLTGYVGAGSSARPKAMTPQELEAIFAAGLRVFAIYQDNDPIVNYYTYDQGRLDGISAVSAALQLGIPENAFIYFAVDCDMMDYQVTSNAIPYFRGIRQAMRETGHMYRVGIYGSRNICTRVSNEKLAKSSFVADMSTGYSGNMGYPIPNNWAFDQFNEYVFTGAAEDFDLDKDAVSGKYIGFNHVENYNEAYVRAGLNEVFEDRAEFLLSKLGISLQANFTFGEPFHITSIPGAKITYRVEVADEIEPDTSNFGEISIVNGAVVETQLTALETKFDGLDVELQEQISSDGTFNIASVFQNEIGTGKIAFWYEFDGSNVLTAHFAIEEEVFSNEITELKLCIYIDIELRNDGNYQSEFANIQQFMGVESAEALELIGFFLLIALLGIAAVYSGVISAAISLCGRLVGIVSGLALAI